MPTYVYACTSCGERIEAVQRITDDPLTTCTSCSGALRKVFQPVGVVFKGSGFYKTDSRKPAAAGGKPAGETPAGEKTSDSQPSSAGAGSSSGSESAGSSASGSSGSAAAASSDRNGKPAAASSPPAGGKAPAAKGSTTAS